MEYKSQGFLAQNYACAYLLRSQYVVLSIYHSQRVEKEI